MCAQRGLMITLLMTLFTLCGAGMTTPPLAADKPTGELRISLAFLGAQRMIPWAEVASGGIKQHQLLIYDHLVGCTDDGQLSAENGIAQAWQEAPDHLSWSFTLRQGVKFHNGSDLTAEDVKFSIDRLFEPKAVAGLLGPTRAAFKEAEVKDPSTVVIHLQQPAIFLPWNFSCAIGNEGMILPKAYFQQVGADGFAKAPIGSGPYKVVEAIEEF